MKFDRAVRLRQLWNGSFHLNLVVRHNVSFGYYLFGTNKDASPQAMSMLGRLADHLMLELTCSYSHYTIS